LAGRGKGRGRAVAFVWESNFFVAGRRGRLAPRLVRRLAGLLLVRVQFAVVAGSWCRQGFGRGTEGAEERGSAGPGGLLSRLAAIAGGRYGWRGEVLMVALALLCGRG
jgi:hypothetical protein